MGSFNFKSVGKTATQKTIETLVKSPTPIGIKTPLAIGNDGNIFAVNYKLSDQMHDNLRNLLLTNWGERLGLYDYGANLRPLTTELVSQDDFDAAAIERIASAVSKWMPFVNLDEFLSVFDRNENKNTAIARITITYSIPALDVAQRALEVSIYSI
jgi:phage baseplate assembly protein W